MKDISHDNDDAFIASIDHELQELYRSAQRNYRFDEYLHIRLRLQALDRKLSYISYYPGSIINLLNQLIIDWNSTEDKDTVIRRAQAELRSLQRMLRRRRITFIKKLLHIPLTYKDAI